MLEGRWTTITPSQFSHEREALAYVQALLPDAEPYRAWSNFTFTAQTGHPYEVDLLVATPGGLYLIEIKSLAGRLTSSGSNWILTNPSGGTRTFDNPLHLADSKAKKLRSLLMTAASQRKGKRVTVPFVQAAVFLAKPGLQVNLSEHHLHNVYGPAPSPGHQPGLPTIGSLLRRPPQDEKHRVTKDLSAALPDLLKTVGIARSRRHYQIGSWELAATPFDVGPTWQDHHARHRDLEREHRRVRIYLVERNAVQAERADAGPVLLHDAAVLARYRAMDRLYELADAARGGAGELWLLCPMEDPASLPKLDGVVVRADDNEWIALPDAWVANAHRATPTLC